MKHPQVDLIKFNKMVDDYHSESDRAAGVLAGSFIDEYTKKYLRSIMISDPKTEEMLNGYGPLSSFSARIDCLYAFGFIDKDVYTNLNIIRKIRNHFAHHPEQTSFDDSPISDFCSNLSTAKPMVLSDKDGDREFRVEKRKNQYLLAITIIVGDMDRYILAKNKDEAKIKTQQVTPSDAMEPRR